MSNPELQQEFKRRVKAASEAMHLTEGEIGDGLSSLGIKMEYDDCIEMLDSDDLTFADLCDVFVDTKKTSKPRLRKAIRCLKASAKAADLDDGVASCIKELSAVEKVVLASKPIERYSDSELITAFVESRDDAMMRELSRRARGRAFVVYAPDQEYKVFNIARTLQMLKEAKLRPTPEICQVDGELVRLYRIDQKEKVLVDTCPIHDTPLFDQFCEHCAKSWAGIDSKMRQRVWIQVHRIEDTKLSSRDIAAMIESAKDQDFDNKYPRAKLELIKWINQHPGEEIPPKRISTDSQSQNTDRRPEAFA